MLKASKTKTMALHSSAAGAHNGLPGFGRAGDAGQLVGSHGPFDVADAYQWVLYLNPEVHTNEYKLVRNAGLEGLIMIQDVRAATGPKPTWLSVLPALVDTRARLAYRGATCIKKMVSIELPPEHAKRLSRMASRRTKWGE